MALALFELYLEQVIITESSLTDSQKGTEFFATPPTFSSSARFENERYPAAAHKGSVGELKRHMPWTEINRLYMTLRRAAVAWMPTTSQRSPWPTVPHDHLYLINSQPNSFKVSISPNVWSSGWVYLLTTRETEMPSQRVEQGSPGTDSSAQFSTFLS